MNAHHKEQSAKLKGEKSIRKRPSDSPTNPNLSNLLKVNRTKVPPKRKLVQSPRKGTTGAKNQKTTTPPDSPFDDEDLELEPARQRKHSKNEDSDYNPQEDPSIQAIAAHKNPRRNNRPTKKPEKYGQSETLTTDVDTEDSENSTQESASQESLITKQLLQRWTVTNNTRHNKRKGRTNPRHKKRMNYKQRPYHHHTRTTTIPLFHNKQPHNSHLRQQLSMKTT